MKYSRILLKLVGEALMGEKGFGIDSSLLEASKWYELYYKSKYKELTEFTNQLISKNLS